MLREHADEMAETHHGHGIGIIEIASLAMMFWNLGKMLLASWRTDDPAEDHAALSRAEEPTLSGRRSRRSAYVRTKRQVRHRFSKYDPSEEWVEAVTQDYMERGKRMGPEGLRAAMGEL
jgi:hypothetical protein